MMGGRVPSTVVVFACALCALAGCAGNKPKPDALLARAASIDVHGSGGERCDGSKPGREVSEYDTSGDGRPDVRKVFVALGSDEDARLVMICRENDVNGDGRKDVIRYYDDQGRSIREEQDRDFDGRMDLVLVFQDGQPMVKELDENHDGKIDTKIFLEDGEPVRAERDLAGRSTPEQWHPDRWEYFEDGRMVRMGTDLDGDSRVDRWDRDHEHKTATESESAIDAAGDVGAEPPPASTPKS